MSITSIRCQNGWHADMPEGCTDDGTVCVCSCHRPGSTYVEPAVRLKATLHPPCTCDHAPCEHSVPQPQLAKTEPPPETRCTTAFPRCEDCHEFVTSCKCVPRDAEGKRKFDFESSSSNLKAITEELWSPAARGMRDQVNDTKQTFASGATSTKQKVDYTLIPPEGLECMGERYTLGAAKHGRNNWRKGIDDEEFRLARISHLIEHALKYADRGNTDGDDNLGAILWGASVLAVIERRRPFVGNASAAELPQDEPQMLTRVRESLRARLDGINMGGDSVVMSLVDQIGKREFAPDKQRFDALVRLYQASIGAFVYADWNRSGGGEECIHGINLGIACRRCDMELANDMPVADGGTR